MIKCQFAFRGLLAGLLVALGHARAPAAERVGDVEVSVLPLPSKDTIEGQPYGVRHGYVEYRVRLKNLSDEVRVVRLSYPPQSTEWLTDCAVATRSVRLTAGQEVLVSLYQPTSEQSLDRMEVSVEGQRKPQMIDAPSLCGWRERSGPARIAVLVSRAVPQEFRDRVFLRPKPQPKPGEPAETESEESGKDLFSFLRSELEVAQWSPNWLGYSCYDAVVLTAEEAERLPGAVLLALRRFVECGGRLLVHGERVPSAVAAGGKALGAEDFAIGFGRAAATRDKGGAGWKATYDKLIGMTVVRYQPEARPSNLQGMLLAETEVPVRGLFLLVLLFGLAIGPANLWLLARHKRRIWLWWDVPAISALTCLAVFAYSLAAEGWTGHGKVASLTLLDEGAHRATTIGYLSYYCPLAPSEALVLSAETDAALLTQGARSRHFRLHGEGGLRLVDWTRDQRLTAGWIKPRVPAYFQVRKSEDRRERVTVERKPDGTLLAVNALGAPIRRLYVTDDQGRVFEARDVAAGAQARLTLVRAAHARGLVRVGDAFAGPWLEEFRRLEQAAPADLLVPGCYLAYLERSPFVDRPLAGVESEDSVAIVYGISKGQDDGR